MTNSTAPDLNKALVIIDLINSYRGSIRNREGLDELLQKTTEFIILEMQFQDCVIYLLDKKGEFLIQRSSHGRFAPPEQAIENPIKIALGMGIVGSSAKTETASIVNDCTEDVRYIPVDGSRLSEISVPIFVNGNLYGMLDCEHDEIAFFTIDHLQNLASISSIMATRIEGFSAVEVMLNPNIVTNDDSSRLQSSIDQLMKSLTNSKYLLGKMQHQVKNQMQMIYSLISTLNPQVKSADC